jgi:hypothetical protein
MSRVDAQNTIYNLIISMVDSWMCPFRPCACPPPWKEYPFKGWFVCVFILTLASNYFIYFSHGDDHRESSKMTKLSLTNLQKWLWTPRTRNSPLSQANLQKWLLFKRGIQHAKRPNTVHSIVCCLVLIFKSDNYPRSSEEYNMRNDQTLSIVSCKSS